MVKRYLWHQQHTGSDLPTFLLQLQAVWVDGGDEHRHLCCEQFSVDCDAVGRFLHFKRRSSKNVKGGLQQKGITVKNLKNFVQPELGDHCIVDVYNLYFGYVPQTGQPYCKTLAVTLPSLAPCALVTSSWQGWWRKCVRKQGSRVTLWSTQAKSLVHPGYLNIMWMNNSLCTRWGTEVVQIGCISDPNRTQLNGVESSTTTIT